MLSRFKIVNALTLGSTPIVVALSHQPIVEKLFRKENTIIDILFGSYSSQRFETVHGFRDL